MSGGDLAIAATLSGLAGAVLGGLGVIYTRGRSDGRRDEVIEGHERRLNSMREKVQKLEDDSRKTGEAVARLEEKVDGIKEATEETRGYVRQLVAGQGKR